MFKKERNLVNLSNVVTAVSANRLSVPIWVSRKPATASLQAGFSEKSFITWSFFSYKSKPHKRYVDSYGWSDYDNSVFKGDCREVIDRRKPLRQQR